MKILEVKSLAIPDVKLLKYQRFPDERGYFTETYRREDIAKVIPELENVGQSNESSSKRGTVRGLHFQWEPTQSKFIRVLQGTVIDVLLDIRKGSPYFGKIVGYELKSDLSRDFGEWIWGPKGFAHGLFFMEDGLVEYYNDVAYNPQCEGSISPLSQDIDWSLFDTQLKVKVDEILKNPIITDKDRNGFTVEAWKNSAESAKFIYSS